MRWLVLLPAILALVSCRKEDLTLSYTELQLPVHTPVRCIEASDEGFLTGGGETEGSGFVCRIAADLDGAIVLTDDLPFAVYDLVHWRDRWYFGLDSAVLYFSDDLVEFSSHYFSEPDWIIELYQQPWRRFAYTSDVLFGLCGGGNNFGSLFQTYDSTQRWNPLIFDNEMRTVFCLSEPRFRAWIAGNGRLMRLDARGGEWQRIRLDDSFIADLHFRNLDEGIALEYDGNILRTADGGDSWSKVFSGSSWRFMNRLVHDGEGRYLAVGNNGVVGYSADAGDNWRWARLDGRPDLYDALIGNGRAILAAEGGRVLLIDWPVKG